MLHLLNSFEELSKSGRFPVNNGQFLRDSRKSVTLEILLTELVSEDETKSSPGWFCLGFREPKDDPDRFYDMSALFLFDVIDMTSAMIFCLFYLLLLNPFFSLF